MSMGDRCVGRGLVTLNNYLVSADDDIGVEHAYLGTSERRRYYSRRRA